MEEREVTLEDIVRILKNNKKDLEKCARAEITENLQKLSVIAESRYMEFTDLTWLDAAIRRLTEEAEKTESANKAIEEVSRYGAW